jgi:hypothetical protein
MPRRISLRRTDVPFLKPTEIENDALALLAEYARDREPITEPPIPIDEIIELQLKLKFEIRDLRQLFGVGDVYGAIWLQERRVAVDLRLDPDRNPRMLGRYHYTLAHEGGHERLHRPYFVPDQNQRPLFSGDLGKPTYICRSSEATKSVEWQANQYAANLLMPRAMVLKEWREWRGDDAPVAIREIPTELSGTNAAAIRENGELPLPGAIDDPLVEEFCRPLADRFEVSPQAMRIRLQEIGRLVREKQATLF